MPGKDRSNRSPWAATLAWLICGLASAACTGGSSSTHTRYATCPPQRASDLSARIRLNQPTSGALVHSPLEIAGEARGPWYFEADFPVRLIDGSGRQIAEHYATAQAEWMTEDFVPFRAQLSFETPSTRDGFLILERANPSGLAEHADALWVPVRFAAD